MASFFMISASAEKKISHTSCGERSYRTASGVYACTGMTAARSKSLRNWMQSCQAMQQGLYKLFITVICTKIDIGICLVFTQVHEETNLQISALPHWSFQPGRLFFQVHYNNITGRICNTTTEDHDLTVMRIQEDLRNECNAGFQIFFLTFITPPFSIREEPAHVIPAHPRERHQRHLTGSRSLLAGSSESLVLALRFHIEPSWTVYTIDHIHKDTS